MTVLAFNLPDPSPTAQPNPVPSLFVVPKPINPPTFDYQALKAAFRQRAKELDIDPIAGASVYQAANVKAMNHKADHTRRMRALVEQNAAARTPDTTHEEWVWSEQCVDCRPPGARTNTHRWTLQEVRYVQWDNGSGAVDNINVERRARRDWFTIDSRMWAQGPSTLAVIPDKIDLHGHVDSPTEFVAIANVRTEAVLAETERDVERKYNRVELLNDVSPRRYFQMKRRNGGRRVA